MVTAPDTSSPRLIGLSGLGQYLDLLGLIHGTSRIGPKPQPRHGPSGSVREQDGVGYANSIRAPVETLGLHDLQAEPILRTRQG